MDQSVTGGDGRRLLPAMRGLLLAFGVLTSLGVVTLFVLSDQTDRYFAWTIAPPATAAFLGAGYASGTVLVVLSLRAGIWAHTRIPMVTILVFTALSLAATLLHLDRFHFGGPGLIARFAAWFWTAVYVVVPVCMVLAMIAQERAQGSDPRRRLPLPGWLRGLLLGEGVVMFTVGAALFAAPTSQRALWPWQLTPLTARAVASWLLAFGVAVALSVGDGDLARLHAAAVAYTVFGALQLVVLLRFAGQVRWTAPSAAAYLVVAATVAATGLAGLIAAGRSPMRPTAAPGRARRDA